LRRDFGTLAGTAVAIQFSSTAPDNMQNYPQTKQDSILDGCARLHFRLANSVKEGSPSSTVPAPDDNWIPRLLQIPP
jgi:hypothetical protein